MSGFFSILNLQITNMFALQKNCNFIYFTTIFFSRSLRRMSPFNWNGLKVFLLRLCLLPAFYFLLWIFYYHGFDQGSDVSNNLKFPFFHFHPHAVSRVYFSFFSWQQDNQYQRTFVTRNGLVFNCLAGAYFTGIIMTACTSNVKTKDRGCTEKKFPRPKLVY